MIAPGSRRTKALAATATLTVVAFLLVGLVYRARGSKPPPPAPRATALPGGVKTPEYGSVQGPRFANANVIVISIDTLRRDHLAPYGATFETAARAPGA